MVLKVATVKRSSVSENQRTPRSRGAAKASMQRICTRGKFRVTKHAAIHVDFLQQLQIETEWAMKREVTSRLLTAVPVKALAPARNPTEKSTSLISPMISHAMNCLSMYPAFGQDSGPLKVNSQRPSSRDRNVCFYSLLDGR